MFQCMVTLVLHGPIDQDIIIDADNLEPRSPTARRKGDLVMFDFEHAHRQQGPIYGPCCYCAYMYE